MTTISQKHAANSCDATSKNPRNASLSLHRACVTMAVTTIKTWLLSVGRVDKVCPSQLTENVYTHEDMYTHEDVYTHY